MFSTLFLQTLYRNKALKTRGKQITAATNAASTMGEAA